MKLYLSLLLSFLFVSCSLEETLKQDRKKKLARAEDAYKLKEEPTTSPREEKEREEGCKPIQNKDISIKKAFFGLDIKIVIATYTEEYASKVAREDKNRGEPSFTQEVTLNEIQKSKFFDLLYGRKGNDEPKKCYEPYHLVRFFKNDKEVAKIEICFGCGASHSFGINPPLCDASVSDIALFFKEVGLKPVY
jgi:hypothetical protein